MLIVPFLFYFFKQFILYRSDCFTNKPTIYVVFTTYLTIRFSIHNMFNNKRSLIDIICLKLRTDISLDFFSYCNRINLLFNRLFPCDYDESPQELAHHVPLIDNQHLDSFVLPPPICCGVFRTKLYSMHLSVQFCTGAGHSVLLTGLPVYRRPTIDRLFLRPCAGQTGGRKAEESRFRTCSRRAVGVGSTCLVSRSTHERDVS